MARKKIDSNIELDEEKASKVKKDFSPFIDKWESVEGFFKNKICYNQTEINPFFAPEKCFEIYIDVIRNKSLGERIKIILKALGKRFLARTLYSDFGTLIELLPYFSSNTHLLVLGDKGTGKTAIYTSYTDAPIIFSEAPTLSELRGDKRKDNEQINPALKNTIICFDEVADYDSREVVGLLKSYESSGVFPLQGSENIKSECSIVMCANTIHPIERFKKLTAKNIMKDILPEFSTESFLNRQTAIIYHMNIPKMKKDCFLSYGDKGLNIHILLGVMQHIRNNTREISNISIPNDIQIRCHANVIKATTALINLLYPDIDPPKYIIDGILDMVLHFNFSANNEVYNPFQMRNAKFFLEIFKAKESRIERGYIIENRILLKIEEKFVKIPLNPFGVIENRKELEFFRKLEYKNTTSSKLLKIQFSYIHPESNEMRIIQDFYPLYSKDNIFDIEGKKIVFNYELKKVYDDYNQLLIKEILKAGKNGEVLPDGEFKKRELYSEKQLEKSIKKALSLRENVTVKNEVYSYDGKYAIRIINFADFI